MILILHLFLLNGHVKKFTHNKKKPLSTSKYINIYIYIYINIYIYMWLMATLFLLNKKFWSDPPLSDSLMLSI